MQDTPAHAGVIKVKQISTSAVDSITEDARRQLVERILATRGFSRSARLTNLLVYVTRKTLEGRTDEISEQQIGVNVFGLPSSYNPAENNVVRSHARLLRQRLDEFYRLEGVDEPLHLTIPKGGYLPVFHVRSVSNELSGSNGNAAPNLLVERLASDSVASSSPRSWNSTTFLRIVALILAIALALVGIAWLSDGPNAEAARQKLALSRNSGPAHALWSRMFEINRSTLVVVADSALVMHQNFASRPISLREYLSRQYLTSPVAQPGLPQAKLVNGLAGRRYTSYADLALVSRLLILPEIVPNRLRVGFARDLAMDDFKQNNVILSGAVEANPWLELYADRLTFDLQEDHARKIFHIANLQPTGSEKKSYDYDPEDSSQVAYSVLAFLPGTGEKGNVLVVEGTTTAGTEAAADFVLNQQALAPILQQARNKSGSLGGFEVLLSTRNVAGSAPEAQVVTSHYMKAGS